jgi:beta-N-acetylglucosaminidase
MIELLKINDACYAILGVVYFIRELLKIIFIIIPIVLIVMLSLDFAKGVISVNDKNKVLKIVIQRIIYAMIIFLIPSTVYGLFNILGVDSKDSDECWTYIGETNIEMVKSLDKARDESLAAQTEEMQQKLQEKLSKKEIGLATTSKVVSSSSSSSSNSSDDKVTLDWDDLTKISNLSAPELKKALNKTSNLKKFSKYSSNLIAAEQTYNVNVFFLIGVEAHESAILSSNLSKDCNNLGGVKGKTYCKGHSKYRKFSSINAFIDYHGELLGKQYLTKGGKYYHGKSINNIVKTYCGSCSDWISGIKKFGNEVYEKAK